MTDKNPRELVRDEWCAVQEELYREIQANFCHPRHHKLYRELLRRDSMRKIPDPCKYLEPNPPLSYFLQSPCTLDPEVFKWITPWLPVDETFLLVIPCWLDCIVFGSIRSFTADSMLNGVWNVQRGESSYWARDAADYVSDHLVRLSMENPEAFSILNEDQVTVIFKVIRVHLAWNYMSQRPNIFQAHTSLQQVLGMQQP